MSYKKLFFLPSLLIVFFLFYTPVQAADYVCTWTKENVTTIQSYPPVTTVSCPTPTSACSECTTAKPDDSYLCCKHTAPAATTATTAEPKFKLPDYVFQIPIGSLTKLNAVDCSSGTCEVPFIAQYISAVYNYGLTIAGILGVLMLMAAGLLWMVSGGDSGKITTAKNMILGSITGLLLVVGLSLFLSFINPDLVNLKPISLPSIKRIEIIPDDDTSEITVGDVTPYLAGCNAARKGDLSVCRAYGEAQPPNLITVTAQKGQTKVNADTYKKYQAALDCVKAKNGGKDLFIINEGFRSAATQISYKEKGLPAATPCCSNHGSGQAMDIHRIDGVTMSWNYDESSGLKACMNAQGLYANLHKPTQKQPEAEAWHWSPTGN